jgi:hypothetical protein
MLFQDVDLCDKLVIEYPLRLVVRIFGLAIVYIDTVLGTKDEPTAAVYSNISCLKILVLLWCGLPAGTQQLILIIALKYASLTIVLA